MKERNRDPEFRWIYANGFGVQMSDNELMLALGITEDVSNPDQSVREQVGVVLTPRSAKLLSHILAQTISGWEAATGRTIEFDPGKVKEIEGRLEAGTVRKK